MFLVPIRVSLSHGALVSFTPRKLGHILAKIYEEHYGNRLCEKLLLMGCVPYATVVSTAMYISINFFLG